MGGFVLAPVNSLPCFWIPSANHEYRRRGFKREKIHFDCFCKSPVKLKRIDKRRIPVDCGTRIVEGLHEY
jgi:hypothetical protein